MIHVLATLELAPGTRAAFLAEFARVLPLVLAEPGCIEYAPAVDADTDLAMQSALGPDRLAIIERWASVDALRVHDAAPHMLAYRERVKDWVRGKEIRILVAAGAQARKIPPR